MTGIGVVKRVNPSRVSRRSQPERRRTGGGPEGAQRKKRERSGSNKDSTGGAPLNGCAQGVAERTVHVRVRQFLGKALEVFAT
eukprot:4044699-Pleurochrysis_carterae.AAC.1